MTQKLNLASLALLALAFAPMDGMADSHSAAIHDLPSIFPAPSKPAPSKMDIMAENPLAGIQDLNSSFSAPSKESSLQRQPSQSDVTVEEFTDADANATSQKAASKSTQQSVEPAPSKGFFRSVKTWINKFVSYVSSFFSA